MGSLILFEEWMEGGKQEDGEAEGEEGVGTGIGIWNKKTLFEKYKFKLKKIKGKKAIEIFKTHISVQPN